jgi:glycosyltransferase involved in cell wall biosynthesis
MIPGSRKRIIGCPIHNDNDYPWIVMKALLRWPQRLGRKLSTLDGRHIIIVGAFPKGSIPQQGILLKQYFERERYYVHLTAKTGRRWYRPIQVVLDCIFLGWRKDIFLVQIFGGPSFIYETAAILIGRFYRKRIVCILRGGNLHRFAEKCPRWIRFVLGRAHQLVVPSSFLQELAQTFGRPVLLIPNLIDIDKYKFAPHEPRGPKLLWMRAFISFYNPLMAVQAFEQIRKLYPNAILTMAGKEGPELLRCREYAEKQRLSGLHFVGLIDKAKIPDFAAEHDIWLNTNDVDNMPVTLIEMWALGLPVVTTDAGGILHLVNPEEDALVVPKRQPKAMADACFRLLKEPNLAGRLVTNGRKRSEACSWPELRSSWLLALEGKKPCVE